MKTTNNHQLAGRLAAVLSVAIAFGISVRAQSDAGSNNSNTAEAYDRLEVLMASTEAAIQYVVPSVEDVEIYEAQERLELLAQETERTLRYDALPVVIADLNEAFERLESLVSKTENEIRYRVSELEPVLLAEEAEQENEHRHFLAFFNADFKKSLTK